MWEERKGEQARHSCDDNRISFRVQSVFPSSSFSLHRPLPKHVQSATYWAYRICPGYSVTQIARVSDSHARETEPPRVLKLGRFYAEGMADALDPAMFGVAKNATRESSQRSALSSQCWIPCLLSHYALRPP